MFYNFILKNFFFLYSGLLEWYILYFIKMVIVIVQLNRTSQVSL